MTPLQRAVTATLFTALVCTTLNAQERVGTVEGQVTDPSGSAVANAKVELSGGNVTQSRNTDQTGHYNFGAVPPGTYTVAITQPGFRVFKIDAVSVAVGRNSRVDAKLEVGAVTETISVSGEAVQIDTASAVVSTAVTADIYDKLPKGRSFDTLLLMAPGTRPETKGGGVQVDGASGSENTFSLDGVEVTNIQTGVLNRQNRVPIEWVQETTLKSSGIDAQFGGAVGGVVSATTKSGTNAFHGQLSYYLNSSSLGNWRFFDSAGFRNDGTRRILRFNPSDSAQNTPEYFTPREDGYTGHNPGYQIGGPMIKNKLWFFSSAYPEFNNIDRTVTHIRDNVTKVWPVRERQDYTLNKVDFQPTQNLRFFVGYQYNPQRVRGLLPSVQGTDASNAPLDGQGYRRPYQSVNYQGDWTIGSRTLLSVFGGYQYNNFKDYGVPRGTRYRYNNSNQNLPFTAQLPANVVGPAGNFTPDNRQTIKDIYERNNLNIIGSHLVGSHNLRFGYTLNRMQNSPIAGAWADGYIFVYWNLGYNAVTKPLRNQRGTYGYYINRSFATQGDVSGRNQGLFFQDNWRVSKKLTLNLGIRTDNEYVPSYRTDSGIASKAIQFGWGDKFAPRLGFAYDPSGTGKMKIAGGYGVVYDLFKYELPRGSFGGDKWVDYYYTLDTPNIFDIKVTPGSVGNAGTFPGTLIESVDRRIPSNDPTNNLIEPDLKPMKQSAFDLSYEYLFQNNFVARARYTRKVLNQAIDDVGILGSQGEQYFIANPGRGVTIDPKNFPAGYPANVTPKAQRDYDGLEFTLERRYAKGYFLQASYIWSRLYGNYAGLANSDENGRTSPNVNRVYDLPWMMYDASGKLVYGRLGTDRPHTLKLFGSYEKGWKGGTTRFSPVFLAYSGTPLTTELHIDGVPVFPFGRGDLGRTPVFSQMDFAVMHDFKVTENKKLRFELNFKNLFNQSTATDREKNIDHQSDSGLVFDNTADIFKGYNVQQQLPLNETRLNPQYKMDSAFQGPREIRLGLHFIF